MPRYRKASVYLKNGRPWRKSGQTILDDVRSREARKGKPTQKRVTTWASEQKEAQDAIAELRAEVEAAKAKKGRKTTG